MKIFNTPILLILAFAGLLCGRASSSIIEDPYHYIGADAQIRYMKFNKGFGRHILGNYSPTVNFYTGVRLNPSCSIEAGHTFSGLRLKRSYIEAYDENFGHVPEANIGYETKGRITEFHLSLIGHYPLDEENKIKLSGSIGLSRSIARFNRKTKFMDSFARNASRRFYGKKKGLRTSIGIDYSVTCNFGIRGAVIFVKTNGLKGLTNDSFVTHSFVAKNSVIYSIGPFLEF